MLDVKHTDEPWRVEEIGDRRNFLTIARDDTSILTVVEECNHHFGAVFNPDDALRIVACVNACRGIEQAVLENPEYRIKAELDNLDAQIGSRIKAEKERDELKKALIALEQSARSVEVSIYIGTPVEFSIEQLRDELIRVREVLNMEIGV